MKGERKGRRSARTKGLGPRENIVVVDVAVSVVGTNVASVLPVHSIENTKRSSSRHDSPPPRFRSTLFVVIVLARDARLGLAPLNTDSPVH